MAKSANKERTRAGSKETASHDRPRFRLLTLKVNGTERPGRIAIPELVVLCQQAQSAIDRQAESLKGKNTLRPGPTIEEVRLECTLELASLSRGSTKLGFDLARTQPSFPVMAALGEDAIAGVVEAIEAISEGRARAVDPGVLDSLNAMGGIFESQRVRSVEWIAHRRNGHARPKRISATFDPRIKETVAQLVRSPTVSRITVEGIIEMADFKPGDLKCRILQPLGPSVPCTFAEEDADSVYGVLRKSARIEGDAVVNPQTGRIDNLRIVSVTPISSLALGKGNFWHGLSLEELARAQEIEPLMDPAVLSGGLPDDADVDALLAEIYRQRE